MLKGTICTLHVCLQHALGFSLLFLEIHHIFFLMHFVLCISLISVYFIPSLYLNDYEFCAVVKSLCLLPLKSTENLVTETENIFPVSCGSYCSL